MAVASKKLHRSSCKASLHSRKPDLKIRSSVRALQALRRVQGRQRKQVFRCSQKLGPQPALYRETSPATALCLRVSLNSPSSLVQHIRLKESRRRPGLLHYRIRRRLQVPLLPLIKQLTVFFSSRHRSPVDRQVVNTSLSLHFLPHPNRCCLDHPLSSFPSQIPGRTFYCKIVDGLRAALV